MYFDSSKNKNDLIFVLLLWQVFKNLNLFMKGKQGGDDLFDRLSVSILFIWLLINYE